MRPLLTAALVLAIAVPVPAGAGHLESIRWKDHTLTDLRCTRHGPDPYTIRNAKQPVQDLPDRAHLLGTEKAFETFWQTGCASGVGWKKSALVYIGVKTSTGFSIKKVQRKGSTLRVTIEVRQYCSGAAPPPPTVRHHWLTVSKGARKVELITTHETPTAACSAVPSAAPPR